MAAAIKCAHVIVVLDSDSLFSYYAPNIVEIRMSIPRRNYDEPQRCVSVVPQAGVLYTSG